MPNFHIAVGCRASTGAARVGEVRASWFEPMDGEDVVAEASCIGIPSSAGCFRPDQSCIWVVVQHQSDGPKAAPWGRSRRGPGSPWSSGSPASAQPVPAGIAPTHARGTELASYRVQRNILAGSSEAEQRPWSWLKCEGHAATGGPAPWREVVWNDATGVWANA